MADRKKLISEVVNYFMTLKRSFMMEGKHHTDKNRVTPAQAQVLFTVHQNQDISTTELARILGITTSAATQLIDGLVANGHLRRECCKDDRRSYKIMMSDSCKSHLREIESKIFSKASKVFEVLNDTELKEYLAMTKKIVSQELVKRNEENGK